MNWTFHHRAVTESTNADARAGRPGDVFTADEQTAGRGRLGHSWHSPRGECLLCSIVVDVDGLDPMQTATLPLVAGLAVARAVARRLAKRRVAIKWPNDVLVDGRKICGILCERICAGVVAGIGVNVLQTRFPPELASRATSLAALGAPTTPREMLCAILAELDALLPAWRRDGFPALRPQFAEMDFLKGREVQVLRIDEDPAPLTGLCGGVQDDGSLLVAGESVFAGEAHVAKF